MTPIAAGPTSSRGVSIARKGGRPLGVLNQGLGGNRILHDLRGDSGLRRFDRDVLAQSGVTHAIVMLGTNDLRNRNGKPDEEVTAGADDRRACTRWRCARRRAESSCTARP